VSLRELLAEATSFEAQLALSYLLKGGRAWQPLVNPQKTKVLPRDPPS
jgi:hypothetical protein